MTATLEPPVKSAGINVQVKDLMDQQAMDLKNLDPQTTISSVVGMALSGMSLPPRVMWQALDDRNARVLRNDQTIGEVAEDRKACLTIQPDTILG